MNYQGMDYLTKSLLPSKVVIQNKSITFPQKVKVKDLYEDDNKWMDRIVRNALTVENQIPLILMAVQANQKFYNQATDFSKVLQRSLEKKFKSAINVRLYGSAANHLALKDSDVDVYLEFHNNLQPEIIKKVLPELFLMPKKGFKIFKSFQLIEASVPIFKGVTHSGLQCDISFTSSLPIYKNNVISFFTSINDSISQMIFLLKFWLKKQDLYGGDNSIGSYALISLVIFSLQQKAALPSILSLQKLCPSQEIIEGWPVSFVKNFSQISFTTMSLLEMLKNFFAFYADFNFEKNVVSPFIGKAMQKTDFKNFQSLPLEFEYLKINLKTNPNILNDFDNTMCVQDFIVHSCNITKNVGEKVIKKFKEACLSACKAFEEPDFNNISILFYELFKPITCNSEINYSAKLNDLFKSQRKSEKCSVKIVEIVKSQNPYNYVFKKEPSEKTLKIFEIFIVKKYFIFDDKNPELNKVEIDRFFAFLYDLLTKVMKCEVTFINDENNIRTYECKTNSHVLDKSYIKSVSKQYHITKNNSIIDVAEKMSNYLNLNQVFMSKSAFAIVCTVRNDPTRIVCHLICKEKRKHRALVNSNFSGLFSALNKWTKFEL